MYANSKYTTNLNQSVNKVKSIEIQYHPATEIKERKIGGKSKIDWSLPLSGPERVIIYAYVAAVSHTQYNLIIILMSSSYSLLPCMLKITKWLQVRFVTVKYKIIPKIKQKRVQLRCTGLACHTYVVRSPMNAFLNFSANFKSRLSLHCKLLSSDVECAI